MKSFDFTVIIPSHRPALAVDACTSMFPIVPIVHANDGYVSFSRMINDCIKRCPTEIVIICNDKARPLEYHEHKTVELLENGYGFVALHNFRHFGFHKDLIRKIGFFDERYIGGEYEDFDFLRRIKEADIGVYMGRQITCVQLACSWKNDKAYDWNHTKWKEYGTHTVRLLPEEKYDYDLGPSEGLVFKRWNESILSNQDTPKEFQL